MPTRATRDENGSRTTDRLAPRSGAVRECERYRGELARHRVITADGADYLVATADERRRGQGYVTAAYPVARGYLVMMRQPLYAITSADEPAARDQHNLLVRALSQGGTGVVKARQRSAALRLAERTVSAAPPPAPDTLAPVIPPPVAEPAGTESAGVN